MNTNSIIGIVVFLIILVGAGWFGYTAYQHHTEIAAFPAGYAWSFTPAGQDPASQAPKMKVSLRSPSGKEYIGGTFIGNCFDMRKSNWPLQQGEVQGAVCWWAGGGDEIGIFKENGSFIMKTATVDEQDSTSTPVFTVVQTL